MNIECGARALALAPWGCGGGRLSDGQRGAGRIWRRAVLVASLVTCLVGLTHAAAEYPLTLAVEAKANTATTAVKSSLTIRVDRLMDESRRKRVTDALTYSGYANFVTALRTLPAVGAIELGTRKVEIRYAHEQQEATGGRLLLIADRPLFFLGDPAKARTGYELTMVELRFDAQGGATGTMTGAARVKPSPGGPILDDFAEAPVQLTARISRP
jgi:hypothetical protein